jgi:hypothetical protein
MNLSSQVKISRVISLTEGAAGQTTINATIIDMAGFESVLFVITLGSIATGAAIVFRVEESNAADLTGAADLAGSGLAIADDADEGIRFIDVVRPRKRYVRLVCARGTANSACSAIAIQYGAKQGPTTHQADYVLGETHISPAEGSA